MTYAGMTCRLISVNGWRWDVGAMWDGPCGANSLHVARAAITREAYHGDFWPRTGAGGCASCSAQIPWGAESLALFKGEHPTYDTASGEPEPGDLYWQDWNRPAPGREHYCSGRWSNCDGRHLLVVLPNGHTWDIDSRANNCALPEDTVHRCWVRTGEPGTPSLTIAKDGVTCAAGAGSIQAGDYHGFLTNGALTDG